MQFAALYRELGTSTEMIRALTDAIDQNEAQAKPAPETWSILEMMCHLYDEEREDFREHLDFILHRQHEEWHVIDPQGWVSSRKYNDQDFQEIKDKFFAERRKSLEWLETIANSDWDNTYASQYGAISAGEMLACWVAHDNLHIRQLVELRRHHIEAITHPHSLQYAGDW